MTWVLQWLLQGLAVAGVATAAARLVPASSPRLRHLFWWLALAGVLALPWLPALTAPYASPALDAASNTLAVEVAPPPAWLWTACLTLWAGTALAGLLSLVADLRALHTLKRGTSAMPWPDSGAAGDLRAAAARLRGAQLAISDDLPGACAVGYFAPRVILSSRLVSTLEPAALESIVRHELAHLERFDDWLRLLQRLVLAAAGLHPAVRWISRQIDIEREAACDRIVVERTGNPTGYARALATVAELTAGSMRTGAPGLAPGALVGGAGLHARIVRVLHGRAANPARLRAMSAASVALLALTVSSVAGLPPLVVMATLEPSFRALASLPAGRALLPRLPALQARPVPVSEGRHAASGPRQTSVHDTPVIPAPAEAEAPLVRPEVEAEPAAADTLDVPARRDVRIETSIAGSPLPGRAEAIGARAARAGLATGSRAARAGSAVARFFGKGGQAVADSF